MDVDNARRFFEKITGGAGRPLPAEKLHLLLTYLNMHVRSSEVAPAGSACRSRNF